MRALLAGLCLVAGACAPAPRPGSPLSRPSLPDSVRAERLALAAASKLPRNKFYAGGLKISVALGLRAGRAIVATRIRIDGTPDTASRTVVFLQGDPGVAWVVCEAVLTAIYAPLPESSAGAIALYGLEVGTPIAARSRDGGSELLMKLQEAIVNDRLDSMPGPELRAWLAGKPKCNGFAPPVRESTSIRRPGK